MTLKMLPTKNAQKIKVMKPVFEKLKSCNKLLVNILPRQNLFECYHHVVGSLASRNQLNLAYEIQFALKIATLLFNKGYKRLHKKRE